MGHSVRPYPTFAWSESRARRYQECRRKHYHAVYTAHNGWLPDASPDRRLAWLMGKLVVGWPAALGTTVHRRAEECVRAGMQGRPMPTFAELRAAAARDLNTIYRNSRGRTADFWSDPQRWPVHEGSFYGEASWADDVARVATALDAALDALLSAVELWSIVAVAGPAGVWLPGRWPSFRLEPGGLTVYAAADVIVRPHPGAPAEVWDFKTGGGDGAVDQILTYALGAREGLGAPPGPAPHARYLGRLVHLGAASTPDAYAPFAISDADLAGAATRVQASAAAMRSHLADASANRPSAIDAFPRTTQLWRCTHCPYRGLCEPDDHRVVEPSPARVWPRT